MSPPPLENSQSVIAHFGGWPSFHDANVISYEAPPQDGAGLGFTLHAWTMTSEVDPNGYYVSKDHALVSFRFSGLTEVEMDQFSSANILFGMNVRRVEGSDKLHVDLDSVMDMSGEFRAENGAILSVVPCTEKGLPLRSLPRNS